MIENGSMRWHNRGLSEHFRWIVAVDFLAGFRTPRSLETIMDSTRIDSIRLVRGNGRHSNRLEGQFKCPGAPLVRLHLHHRMSLNSLEHWPVSQIPRGV